MSKHLKNFLTGCIIFLLAFCVIVPPSYAANRTGSHRVGGTNSHGKGSHYAGGHFIEQLSSDFSVSNFNVMKGNCINVKKSADCMN